MPDSLDLAAPLDYHVVDVFTERAYGGNPLAVVLDAESLDTSQLRIFTPTVELPFAGHPSVGTAWLMAALGRVRHGRVVQRWGAGDLPLTVTADGGPVELTGGRPQVSALGDPAAFAAAVGVAGGELLGPVQAAGTGIDWAYVRLAAPAAVDASLGDDAALRELSPGAVYAFSWEGSTSTAYARGWAGGVGIHEDAATGSAALGLGVHLVAVGLLPGDATSAYTVVQGVAMGRPSVLRGRVEARAGVAVRCAVEGDCLLVAKGQIATPR